MLCFLYVMAIGTLLSLAGLCAERLLPDSASRRWVWCAVIGVSMLIPPIYQAKHRLMVSSGAPADPSVWGLISAYDALIMKLWVVASATLLLWGVIDIVRVMIVSRRNTSREVVDGIPVVVTESIGPATVGFFRLRVLVPRWVLGLPEMQRRFVIRHEEEHRRAHDARTLLLPSLLLVLVPWNLALWWQLRRLSLAIEIDCDKRVVSQLGNENTYGELLLNIAQATSRGPRLQPGFVGRGDLELRLRTLLAPTRLSRAMRCVLPVVAVALLYFVLSAPHPVRAAYAASSSNHVHQQ